MERPPSATTAKVSFPALNGLRFWASFGVVISHVEQNKMFLGMPNIFRLTVIDKIGSLGVSFFFVLSGFLITYLLLEERSRTNTVHLGNFYARRALRIWPLYYLVTLSAFFIVPRFYGVLGWSDTLEPHRTAMLILYLFMLPNLSLAFFPEVLCANQLWSIGVEEQFYLVWPCLVRFSKKYLLSVFFLILAVKSALNVMLGYFAAHPGLIHGSFPFDASSIEKWRNFFYMLEIEKLTIGSLGAHLLFYQKKKWLAFIYHPFTLFIAWAGLAGYSCFDFRIKLYGDILGVILLVLLMNACRQKRVLTDHPALEYLGKISYSIYMLHEFIILATLHWLKPFSSAPFFNGLVYALSMAGTIGLSSLSYEFFEKPFLRLKSRFAVVPSG